VVENPNIDKWDLKQMFPKVAMTRCPYCSSTDVYDPLTVMDKVLRFTRVVRWVGHLVLYVIIGQRNDAAYRRRRCRACGFEYSVEAVEPFIFWVVFVLVAAALAGAGALLYVNT
jgi:uncharacterized protein (DUF983 family)